HDADAEVHDVETARGRELEALRGDALGGGSGAAQREVVADELREQRRLARDEAREATRMRRRQFDAGRRRVDEVQQRRGATELGELSAPGVTRGIRDTADRRGGSEQ